MLRGMAYDDDDVGRGIRGREWEEVEGGREKDREREFYNASCCLYLNEI